MVQRYAGAHVGANGMYKFDNGAWVKYEDYERLKAGYNKLADAYLDSLEEKRKVSEDYVELRQTLSASRSYVALEAKTGDAHALGLLRAIDKALKDD